jgi:teichuronic acid biosynthesis glycosyltransferase TuaC
LRVLALTNMWPSAERPSFGVFVANQVSSVLKAGVEVEVYFINGRARRTAYARAALRMLTLNFGPRRWDLVHAHTGHCGALALLQRRYPTLISYVGYDVYGKPTRSGRATFKSRLEALLFRRLARFADGTITKSTAMEDLLPRAARGRNAVLPNGVDRSLFRPVDRDTVRRRLGWPETDVTVLFAGDPDVPRKRFEMAQEACSMASEHLKRLKLRVCSGVAHVDVPLWMNAADALLLTSVAEGSPNVVKEALACNLPVVATDVGDVAELLRDVRLSRIVAARADSRTIAEALVEVLRMAPQRSDGRRRTQHLAAENVAERLISLYVAISRSRRTTSSRRSDPASAFMSPRPARRPARARD